MNTFNYYLYAASALALGSKERVSIIQSFDVVWYRTKLKDSGKLRDYDIKNGAILSLVILPPFLVYVQGADGRKHTVTVKSSEPEVSAVPVKILCDKNFFK